MEQFAKYPKIHRVGHTENEGVFEGTIICQEKIDGANFRFAFINGEVIFGSRTRLLSESEEEAKSFLHCINYIRQKIEQSKLPKHLLNNLIFYGENCVKHTISYDWNKIPQFIGFDVYDIDENKFIDWDDAKYFFEELGLTTTRIIELPDDFHFSQVTDEWVPESEYIAPDAKMRKMEGVVFKNYEKQIFAKYVRDEFKERNAEVFGGTPKYNSDGITQNAEFIFKYCTNARIEKLIFKKLSEGKLLGMELMGELIRDVYLDIIEEEWREILTSNWILDFKSLRKLCAPRVRGVLQQMMETNLRTRGR
jgi:hypothetical protein